MNRLVLKLAFFAALLIGLVAVNGHLADLKAAERADKRALQQAKGLPAHNTDNMVPGTQVPFTVLYLGEVVFLAVAFAFLCGKDVNRVFKARDTKES